MVNSNSLIRAVVAAAWLLFMLMVVAISWMGAVMRGRPPGLSGLLLWNAGWLFWIVGTFIVVRLTRRFPIERNHVGRGIATHTAFGITVGSALLAIEFVLGQGIETLWPQSPRATGLMGFFVYKFHVYFLIYWMILGATRAYDFHAKYRETELRASQLDARLAEAQLHVLKTQLHPHFLFNTHHAIISLMLKQDNTAAIRMLTRLSDLLRITLKKLDQQLSTVRDEVDALDLYLGIQRERYGARLNVEIEIDPATLTAEVPSLLLQPLVENALKHGIDVMACTGNLRIHMRKQAARLHIEVTDNGPGFPRHFALHNSSGIGLGNTSARLLRLYGQEQTLTWRNLTPTGAMVEITLPFRAFQPAEPASQDAAHE